MKDAIGRELLIRADGSAHVGFGHVMRSTAIAEEWLSRGGGCLWVTTLLRGLDAVGSGRDDMRIVTSAVTPGGSDDSQLTRKLAEENDVSWVLVDLPVLHPTWFLSAGSRRARWMIAHDEPLPVNDRIHAILNPGPQADPGFYPGRSDNCDMLLGLGYALVRAEIRERGATARDRQSPPKRILITFGGSDPADLTWRALSALGPALAAEGTRWRVILGPGYHGRCVESIADFFDSSVEFVRYTSNMGGHYAWADLIVCGASTTLWEALYCGVPAMVTPAAANQRLAFEAIGSLRGVRCFSDVNADFVRAMERVVAGDPSERDWLAGVSASGTRPIDGCGATRVVDYMLSRK